MWLSVRICASAPVCWRLHCIWSAPRRRSCWPKRRGQVERVGLSAQLYEPGGGLPLDQQRILEIARALAAHPMLLLLDEPAAGLRPLEKRFLADLLRRLRAEGLGIPAGRA